MPSKANSKPLHFPATRRRTCTPGSYINSRRGSACLKFPTASKINTRLAPNFAPSGPTEGDAKPNGFSLMWVRGGGLWLGTPHIPLPRCHPGGDAGSVPCPPPPKPGGSKRGRTPPEHPIGVMWGQNTLYPPGDWDQDSTEWGCWGHPGDFRASQGWRARGRRPQGGAPGTEGGELRVWEGVLSPRGKDMGYRPA